MPRKIIKAPKIFFGASRKRNDNLVKVSNHSKVIIEGSSGIVKIDVDPMGQESYNHAFSRGHRQFHDSEFFAMFFKK